MRPPHGAFDPTERPMMLYWELTRACELSCRHCRAEAQKSRHPDELSTEEGLQLIKQIGQFGDPLPHVVITGGDPLKRPDLWVFIDALIEQGISTAITPSGTYAINPEVVSQFRQHGIWMVSMSIDGSNPERHDGIRQVPGSFAQTVQACEWCREQGLPMQMNTLVCQQTLDDLPMIYELMKQFGAARWSLFFLIQVGRGKGLEEITPAQAEQLMHTLYGWAKEGPMVIKTTEAPFYRRVALQSDLQNESAAVKGSINRGMGIRDGCGVMFISHLGEVFPSGFVPVVAGNVRDKSPVDIYREADLFQRLRDMNNLKGKCGRCSYKHQCGGSRARALAYTGDVLESDPLCPYQPE